MVRFALVACVLSLLPVMFGGCGRKEKPPAAVVTNTSPEPRKAAPKPKLPGGIPADFTALIEAKWPLIEEEGKAFAARFAEASAARKVDDREKLQTAIEAARGHYNKMSEEWVEIAYWPANAMDDGKIDEKTKDRCERSISMYSKKVKAWMKKAKGLKELSTVK